jgi:hypothetical protein
VGALPGEFGHFDNTSANFKVGDCLFCSVVGAQEGVKLWRRGGFSISKCFVGQFSVNFRDVQMLTRDQIFLDLSPRGLNYDSTLIDCPKIIKDQWQYEPKRSGWESYSRLWLGGYEKTGLEYEHRS